MEPEQGNSAPQPEKEETPLRSDNNTPWHNQPDLALEEDTEENTGETIASLDDSEPSVPTTPFVHDEPAPTPSSPIPEPPKKHSHKKLLAIVITVIVVLGLGGGVAAYYLLGNKPAPKQDKHASLTQSNQTADTQDLPPVTTDKAIAQVIAALKTNYKTVDQDQSPMSGQVQIITNKFSPALKQNGTTYYIAPTKGTTLTLNFAEGDSKTITSVNTFMSEQRQKLALTASSDQSNLSDTPTGVLYQNSSDTYVCDFPASGTDSSSAYPSYSFVCDDRANYTTVAPEMQPLIDAYKTAGNSLDDAIFSALVINKSATAGYSRGQLGINSAHGVGGFEGLFYEKGTTWHYWTGTQEGISCSDAAKDPDIAAAYRGEQCVTSDGQSSTVQ